MKTPISDCLPSPLTPLLLCRGSKEPPNQHLEYVAQAFQYPPGDQGHPTPTEAFFASYLTSTEWIFSNKQHGWVQRKSKAIRLTRFGLTNWCWDLWPLHPMMVEKPTQCAGRRLQKSLVRPCLISVWQTGKRVGVFVCIAQFIHMSNSVCFTKIKTVRNNPVLDVF